jgi:hypothetical protein
VNDVTANQRQNEIELSAADEQLLELIERARSGSSACSCPPHRKIPIWNESSSQRLEAIRKVRNSVMHPASSIARNYAS